MISISYKFAVDDNDNMSCVLPLLVTVSVVGLAAEWPCLLEISEYTQDNKIAN